MEIVRSERPACACAGAREPSWSRRLPAHRRPDRPRPDRRHRHLQPRRRTGQPLGLEHCRPARRGGASDSAAARTSGRRPNQPRAGLPPRCARASTRSTRCSSPVCRTFRDDQHGRRARTEHRASCSSSTASTSSTWATSGHLLSEADLGEIGAVDVVCVPIGGSLTAARAAELVAQLDAKLIVPMPLDDAGGSGGELATFPARDERPARPSRRRS